MIKLFALFTLCLAVPAQIEMVNETTRRITRVYNANKQIKRGKEAYKSGDFKAAADAHRKAVERYGVKNDQATTNLAHAYFQLSDNSNASAQYQQLLQSNNKDLQSIAAMQLGNIAYRNGDKNSAMEWYKKALRANPRNRDARYNYEFVKRKKEEEDKEQQKKQQNQQQKGGNKDKEEEQQSSQQNGNKQDKNDSKSGKEPQGGSQDKNKTGEKNGEKDAQQTEQNKQGIESPDLSKAEEDDNALMKAGKEDLKRMGLSEEKARMLLEAMRNSEVQFLQQQQFSKQKKKKTDKPSW
jgi:tetratricopeptide (TPR) repeat protein